MLAVIVLATAGSVFGAQREFEKVARQALADHAMHYRAGNIKACVAMYATDAKFFVDNKLVASGREQLLDFYKGLRDVDAIKRIEFDEFVDVGSHENTGWVVFNYTKEYDLKNHRDFVQRHQLEGFSTLKARQYGTAVFSKTDGDWKVRIITVFDPEKWEPVK